MISQHALLPRSTPGETGVPSRAISALLDALDQKSYECHSLMVVRKGHLIAEGWWAPFTPQRPQLLYSVTKSFTSIAVGLAIDDGLLSLDDTLAELLPDHVPADVSDQGLRITVHHLLTMTAGHDADSLEAAWRLEPTDLVKGFLRVGFPHAEGTRHAYDNPTTFILARIVERVTGRSLEDYLNERLFRPMGITGAEWDRVSSGATFGFTGLHLPAEELAAIGELLLREGAWGDKQLVPREWLRTATRHHIDTQQVEGWTVSEESRCGYGYQFWMSSHGYRADGAYGQFCLVVPSHDLVVVITSAVMEGLPAVELVWEHLLPAMDQVLDTEPADHQALTERLRALSLTRPHGTGEQARSATATIDASAKDSAYEDATPVQVAPVTDGWSVNLGDLTVEVGASTWRESAPLGRPVVAAGAWQDDVFVADIYVITTPHRVRLEVSAGTGVATATWNLVPLTSSNLERQIRAPLMTRPDVC